MRNRVTVATLAILCTSCADTTVDQGFIQQKWNSGIIGFNYQPQYPIADAVYLQPGDVYLTIAGREQYPDSVKDSVRPFWFASVPEAKTIIQNFYKGRPQIKSSTTGLKDFLDRSAAKPAGLPAIALPGMVVARITQADAAVGGLFGWVQAMFSGSIRSQFDLTAEVKTAWDIRLPVEPAYILLERYACSDPRVGPDNDARRYLSAVANLPRDQLQAARANLYFVHTVVYTDKITYKFTYAEGGGLSLDAKIKIAEEINKAAGAAAAPAADTPKTQPPAAAAASAAAAVPAPAAAAGKPLGEAESKQARAVADAVIKQLADNKKLLDASGAPSAMVTALFADVSGITIDAEFKSPMAIMSRGLDLSIPSDPQQRKAAWGKNCDGVHKISYFDGNQILDN